jgi:hypothetical protein
MSSRHNVIVRHLRHLSSSIIYIYTSHYPFASALYTRPPYTHPPYPFVFGKRILLTHERDRNKQANLITLLRSSLLRYTQSTIHSIPTPLSIPFVLGKRTMSAHQRKHANLIPFVPVPCSVLLRYTQPTIHSIPTPFVLSKRTL